MGPYGVDKLRSILFYESEGIVSENQDIPEDLE